MLTSSSAENDHENRTRTYSNKGKQPKGPSFNISRLQLPILPAYAFTDYKIQGRSLTHVIIDLQGCHSLQSAYVMLSCATSLKGIAIMRWFDPGRINRSLSQQFRDEFARLKQLDELTKLEFENRMQLAADSGP